jgi:hypothetical protein
MELAEALVDGVENLLAQVGKSRAGSGPGPAG